MINGALRGSFLVPGISVDEDKAVYDNRVDYVTV